MSDGECVNVEISMRMNPSPSEPYYLELRADHGLGFDRDCAVHLNSRRIITNDRPSQRTSIAVFACDIYTGRGTFTATLVQDGEAVVTQQLEVLVVPPEPSFRGHLAHNRQCQLTSRLGDDVYDDGRTGNGVAHYQRPMIYMGFVLSSALNPGQLLNCFVGLVEGVMSRRSVDDTISLSGVLRSTGVGPWRFSKDCNIYSKAICQAFSDSGPSFRINRNAQVSLSGTYNAISESRPIELRATITDEVTPEGDN